MVLAENEIICRDGIVTLVVGENAKFICVCYDEEKPMTLASCLEEARAIGYQDGGVLLVIAEDAYDGTIYKYGNHLNAKTREPVWELSGHTNGYA